MTDTTTNDPQALVGLFAFDTNDEEIGEITGVYLDELTREPEWAAVDLGGSVTLVPLAGAAYEEDGVSVAFERQRVIDSPYRQSGLAQAVTPAEEEELKRHYGSENGPSRRRRRSQATSAAAEVASTAAGKGQEVASVAAEHGQQAASVAVERTQQVANVAAQQVSEIAGAAREQAVQVREEVATQARALIDQTRGQIQEQANTQTERLAGGLRQFGAEILALAEGRPEESGALSDYLRQAGDKLTAVAEEVEVRGPGGLVQELQTFARTRPGGFVLGAAIAGFGVGRLLRGASDGGQDDELPDGGGRRGLETDPPVQALPARSGRRPRAASVAR